MRKIMFISGLAESEDEVEGADAGHTMDETIALYDLSPDRGVLDTVDGGQRTSADKHESTNDNDRPTDGVDHSTNRNDRCSHRKALSGSSGSDPSVRSDEDLPECMNDDVGSRTSEETGLSSEEAKFAAGRPVHPTGGNHYYLKMSSTSQLPIPFLERSLPFFNPAQDTLV